MDKFAKIVGRQYKLFDYVGAPDAEKSSFSWVPAPRQPTRRSIISPSKGEKVGVIKVRLYRPFSVKHLIDAIPATVRRSPFSTAPRSPDRSASRSTWTCVGAIEEAMADGIAPFKTYPTIVGGRYGLGSKEFTPAMVKAVFDNLDAAEPKNHFSVGISDDVTDN